MEIVKRLNYDCIGLIYDFLSDDFDFFMFIKVNNLSPQKVLNVENFDWFRISQRDDLPFNIINEYLEFFDWEVLSKNNIRNIEFLKEYENYIRWDVISNEMTFFGFDEYTLFREFKDRLDWKKISRWRGMCELFVDEFAEKLDWDDLTVFQGLSEYLINKHSKKINWKRFSSNQHIPIDFIKKYKYQNDELDDDELKEFMLENDDQEYDIGTNGVQNQDHKVIH